MKIKKRPRITRPENLLCKQNSKTKQTGKGVEGKTKLKEPRGKQKKPLNIYICQ
jgi:hypothetical protein